MKELSIEEKAKAYDEALEKARLVLQERGNEPDGASMLANLFPELKESEDEKIRKELLNAFQESEESLYMVLTPHKRESFIAWLEKQGEQKPILDVEIPFGAKDSELEEVSYNVPNGYHAEIEDNKVVIKKGGQKPTDKVEPKFKVGQTIKKEGFNLGFTIVKIEDCFYYNDMGDYFPFTDQDNWELVEQKPVEWSEEDEDNILHICCWLNEYGNFLLGKGEDKSNRIFKTVDWLKSIKNRCLPQPKQEWSEEDDEHLERILKELGNQRQRPLNSPYLDKIESDYNWLKSLRPQSQWKPSEYEIQLLKDVASGVKDPVAYGASMGVIIGGLEQLKAL